MTEKHNRTVRVVKETVVDGNLKFDNQKNTMMGHERLAQGLKALRLHMAFEREGRQHCISEILEFSCPYGSICQKRETLPTVSEQKKVNYSDLANGQGTENSGAPGDEHDNDHSAIDWSRLLGVVKKNFMKSRDATPERPKTGKRHARCRHHIFIQDLASVWREHEIGNKRRRGRGRRTHGRVTEGTRDSTGRE
jgi:hypothetical protein